MFRCWPVHTKAYRLGIGIWSQVKVNDKQFCVYTVCMLLDLNLLNNVLQLIIGCKCPKKTDLAISSQVHLSQVLFFFQGPLHDKPEQLCIEVGEEGGRSTEYLNVFYTEFNL